jgi:hypothetical protein
MDVPSLTHGLSKLPLPDTPDNVIKPSGAPCKRNLENTQPASVFLTKRNYILQLVVLILNAGSV